MILQGIMGLVVGDALGVPVEFMDRESLRRNPVTDMREYGTYNLPRGSWSDDSSMTLCLLDSLAQGLDYRDIMEKFLLWFREGDYTPHGDVFDVGIGTRKALSRFESGLEPLECGGKDEWDNGNGSLMRILPLAFYLKARYGEDYYRQEEAFDIIHKVSSLSHGHKRSMIACGIYLSIAGYLMAGKSLEEGIEEGIGNAFDFYRGKDGFREELGHYSRLEDKNFKNLPEEKIRSGGYVVDSLEASLWVLLNTDSYRSALLKAVNLGSDTDTIGAITGGLAGIFYGYEAIPREWREAIVRKEYIEELCNGLL